MKNNILIVINFYKQNANKKHFYNITTKVKNLVLFTENLKINEMKPSKQNSCKQRIVCNPKKSLKIIGQSMVYKKPFSVEFNTTLS